MPKIPARSRLTAIGSYIFAGGFTLGVRKYFDVKCHLEDGVYGVSTVKINMPELPIYTSYDEWPIDELNEYNVDLVYGNPPCAAWSTAGLLKGQGTDKWKTDPRVNCTVKHFSLLDKLRPKVWIWESVTNAYTKGHEFVSKLTKQAADLGYSTSYVLHDAQWLGLPQTRKRFFMVCHNVEFSPLQPSWDPAPCPAEVLAQVTPGTEYCDTHAFLGPSAEHKKVLLEDLAPGEQLVRAWDRRFLTGPPETWVRNPNNTIKGRPSFGHHRVSIGKPNRTIIGYALVHPTIDRFLSIEEVQALCGYPEDYVFGGRAPIEKIRLVCRAVLPPVAEWIARSVAVALRRKNNRLDDSSPSVTLYDLRKRGDRTDRHEPHFGQH